MRVALFLWARPIDDSTYERGTLSKAALHAAAFAMRDGAPLPSAEAESHEFDGYEVGTQWKTGFDQSTITYQQALALWDEENVNSLRHVDGIIKWNASLTDSATATSLKATFGLVCLIAFDLHTTLK